MKRVLAIGTHPDDIEIGCGGTLLKLREAGWEIHILIATMGEEGGSQKSEEMGRTRKEEALQAAKALGASTVEFLGLPDGLLSIEKTDKIRLIEYLRVLRPDVLFIHSASDQFPDHQVIHRLSKTGYVCAGGPWYPSAKGRPHKVAAVFGFEVWNPINQCQLTVDITQQMEKKLTVLSHHRSQLESIRYDHAVKGLGAYRGATSGRGIFAESFEVVEISDDFSLNI